MRADAEPVVQSGSSESSLDRPDLGDRDGDAFCGGRGGEAERWSGGAAFVTPYNSSKISSAIVCVLSQD